MKNKILVVTNKRDDAHTDEFFRYCEEKGFDDAIRLNTDDFLSNTVVTFDGKRFSIRILDSQREVSSDEVLSVWYRRPVDLIPPADVADSGAQELCVSQGHSFLRSLYFATHGSALWMNPLPSLHAARHKLPQLMLAQKMGLRVPETLVTNDADRALSFLERYGVVCMKSLSQPNFEISGKTRAFMTTLVQLSELGQYVDRIRMYPIFLQQYIKKRFDVRVTVIGKKIFAVRIDSQSHPSSLIDVRGVAPDRLEHRRIELPSSIEGSLIRFMESQCLVFSAFDLVVDNDGEYVFIENNPNGQWLWLEKEAGIQTMEYLFQYLSCGGI